MKPSYSLGQKVNFGPYRGIVILVDGYIAVRLPDGSVQNFSFIGDPLDEHLLFLGIKLTAEQSDIGPE